MYYMCWWITIIIIVFSLTLHLKFSSTKNVEAIPIFKKTTTNKHLQQQHQNNKKLNKQNKKYDA